MRVGTLLALFPLMTQAINHKNRVANVLLIDNVSQNVENYSAMLKKLGVHLMVANCGFEACLLMQQTLPDLILFNYEALENEQDNFVKLLKQDPFLVQVPLIAILQDHHEAVLEQIIEHGCDHFFYHSELGQQKRIPETISKVLRYL